MSRQRWYTCIRTDQITSYTFRKGTSKMGELNTSCPSTKVVEQLVATLKESRPDEFPRSVREALKSACVWLITNSNRTWIDFWQYFYKLFNLKDLASIRQRITSPRWTIKTWNSTYKTALYDYLHNVSNDKEIMEELIKCSIEDCEDVQVLKLILELYSTFTRSAKVGGTVVDCAVRRLDKIIQRMPSKNLWELLDVFEYVSFAHVGETTRRLVVNYLSQHTWERSQCSIIREVVTGARLYQTSDDLMVVIRNMLNQSDVFRVHHMFIHIVTNAKIMKVASTVAIKDMFKIAVESIASSCRSHHQNSEETLRLTYKILAAIKASSHLSCIAYLLESTENLVYLTFKEVSLNNFFRMLLPGGEQKSNSPGLSIIASHIKQRLKEDKHSGLSKPVVSMNYLKMLQDSAGYIRITSTPMKDVLMTLLDLQEEYISDDQLSHSGNASLRFEAGIMKILEDSEFWLLVFNSKGRYSKVLKSHQKCEAVSKALQHLGNFILEGNITINFAMTFQKEKQHSTTLVRLLETVHPCSSGETDNWKNCVTGLQEQYDQFNSRIQNLSTFRNKCVDMFSARVDVSDKASLVKNLRRVQMLETQKESTLEDTQNNEFWGPLFPLLDMTKNLKDVICSTVFLNICLSVIEGNCPDIPPELDSSMGLGADKYKFNAKTEKKADKAGLSELEMVSVSEEEEESDDDDEYFSALSSEDDLEISGNDERSALQNNDRTVHSGNQLTGERVLSSVLNKKAINTMNLAMLLVEVCKPIFQQHCAILFKGSLNIPVCVIENMMTGLSSRDELQEEMKKVERIFGETVPPTMCEALNRQIELPGLREHAKQLRSLFRTFDVNVDKGDIVKNAIQELTDLHFNQKLTLQQVYDAIQTIHETIKGLKDNDWEIVDQLAIAKELVIFLREVADEDLRNLIDAVEERAEQYVSESTVSDLIDVRRYMDALLKVQPPNQTTKLIEVIEQKRSLASKVTHLPTKINSCVHNVHSLRDLYNNVANRGEMTKQIIHNALKQGIYSFCMDETSETCNVVLSYKRENSDVMHGLDQLNDYRNRAFLIINTKKHADEILVEGDINDHTSLSPHDFELFISCVSTTNDIVEICSRLRQSGHFSFRRFEKTAHSFEELQNIKTDLKRKLDYWLNILGEARDKYYYLNFFPSKQLWTLDQFFGGDYDLTEDLIALFKFVDFEVPVDECARACYQNSVHKFDLQTRLFYLGMALEKIFHGRTSIERKVPGQIKSEKGTLDSKVCKGDVFVVELEEESTKSIAVLLRLYFNTTGILPEPSQVIFCHEKTAWEDISLLLQRCIKAYDHSKVDRLFTLVNVERLPMETQFQLVNEVQQMKGDRTDFLLAMICRGGSYHHIIDTFSPKHTHRLQGLSDAEMMLCLRTGWPEVEVVTSSQPGLGKTEYIKDIALKRDLGVCTFPINGPITKDYLVNQLKALPMTKWDVLHIDTSPVSDPDLLDIFLFELIVIGMAVTGTNMCISPVGRIAIEVANTYEDKFRNTLTVCSSFKRVHLEWTEFDNFIISQDTNSSVQVVCHYLKALNNGSLDKSDIVFIGSNCVNSLSQNECRKLLSNLFGSIVTDISYATLESFLAIFAGELRRLSASIYFRRENLIYMLGKGENNVRSKLVEALLNVSKDFTARSVKRQAIETTSAMNAATELLESRSSSEVSANKMVSRMQGMVKWADSNHLLVVFHRGDPQTVSTLYGVLDKVTKNVRKLFEGQMRRDMFDYEKMNQEQLHEILEKVCRTSRGQFQKERLGDLQTNYALTPDNLLKMVLIHMRIKAHIPVIIMGETGCGKTTLITYLARVCEVPFEVLNLHAGMTEEDIIDFVSSLKVQAEQNLKQEVWGFLDEINTCDQFGLLNEIICHHSLKGISLPSNLTFLAACNPYRLRKVTMESAGLEGKQHHEEISKLVYRVHPLPETMMDFVWDYGSLDKNDEVAYIRKMLDLQDDMFVDLVAMSQNFMRDVEKTSYCVSLRDVYRCKHLAAWFAEMLKNKSIAHVDGNEEHCNSIKIRSMILALAHCYHSRLTMAADRQTYRRKIAKILSETNPRRAVKEGDIDQMIRSEQLDILNRMQLKEGTAKNEALRENVFVMLVSILNRIPVFVIGKPGCSKSLSMQLIRSNLRGPDSTDTYFKSLPPVYVVSYQGSESSTSEGIIKVFEKAKNYKVHKQEVMPVVLLDEIGLAEVSSSNPLKVLHSQLEPTVGDFPPVAVVGISNWALDAAKMNRAIHLSRPEPTIEDLADTAKSIRNECAMKKSRSTVHHIVNDEKLQSLAKAYSDYQANQKHANFHGLRDYYSLVKYVAIHSSAELHGDPAEILQGGILRNFGGLSCSETLEIVSRFAIEADIIHTNDKGQGKMQWIGDNIDDKNARHLMLITSGDSAINILEQSLEGRQHVTILGSRFANDVSEEYNYTILSQIILHMERGVKLVLRDLENIYGSLYDMLNQNYTEVGKKKNCRVALGPYSNPMCEVHQDFRCIVLVDEKKVDYQNPPFLNRFEKQTLRFSDLLTDLQNRTISCIRQWIYDISVVEGYHFSENDMFLGLHSDTLPSLVYLRSQDLDLSVDITPEELAQRCKSNLTQIACPDAVLRASWSRLMTKNYAEVERFREQFFHLPLHNGIKDFFDDYLNNPRRELTTHESFESSGSTRTIIYTHCSVHTDIGKLLADCVTVQVKKLSTFRSEQHLNAQIRQFWFESTAEMLVLQCLISHDAAHMLLAKNRIDQYRREYFSSVQTTGTLKHACIVVHIDQNDNNGDNYPWQFNFLCGWEQFTLDSLEPSHPRLLDLLHGSISDHLSGTVDFGEIIQDQILWCFSCIRYEDQNRDLENVLHLAAKIARSSDFVQCLKKQVLSACHKSGVSDQSSDWQIDVATNRDLLYRCSTLTGALIEYIKQHVREPLGKIIVQLEKVNAWCGSPCDPIANEAMLRFWQACFNNSAVFDINSENVLTPRGPESCLIHCNFVKLQYPFFTIFHDKIESNREWLLHVDDQKKRMAALCDQLTEVISHVPGLQYEYYLEDNLQDYVSDLYNTFSIEYAPSMTVDMRVYVMKWLVSHVLPHVLLAPSEDKESVEHKLARLYVNMWLNSDLLAAQLQLISIYTDVTSADPKTLIDQVEGIIHVNPKVISKPAYGSDDEDLKAFDKNIEQTIHKDTSESDDDTDDESEADKEASPKREEQASPDVQSITTSDDDIESVTISEDGIDTKADSRKTGDGSKYSIAHEDMDRLNKKETVLVTQVCKDVLPKRKVLLTCGGFDGWLRGANSVILLAGRVDADSATFHFLRLCRDFVVLLCNEFDITEEQLVQLGTLGEKLDDPLSSKDVFQFILPLVKTLKVKETDKVRLSRLDNFLTTYFGLCLEANLDTLLLPQIIDTLCADTDELLPGSRPVLLNIIRSDSMDGKSDPVCETLISSGVLDKDKFPNLAMLDDTLTEQKVDSHLSAACCDIIEEVAFEHITCDCIADIKSGDDTIWKLASKAVTIIGDRSQEHSSLQLVAAAAYIRAITKAVSELIHITDSKHFKVGCKYNVLANLLNGLMNPDEDARCECNLSLVQVHLLKSLRQQQSLFSLRKLCAELRDPITNLRKIAWQESLFASRLGFCPMSYVNHYNTAVDAISAWQIRQDKTEIITFISTARKSPAHRLAFLAAIASMFYFVQSTIGLRDVDKQQAQWLFEATTDSFNRYYQHILERLLGLADFHGVLQISESISHETLQIASVIIHVIAIIVSNLDQNSADTAFLTFFRLDPPISKDLLPATGNPSSVFKVPHSEKLEYYDCVCRLRVAESINAERVVKCPICNREHRNNTNANSGRDIKEYHQGKPFSQPSVNRGFKALSTESLPGLSPVAYRTIDTLVRACIVGGLASGIVSSDQVPSELMDSTRIAQSYEGDAEAAAGVRSVDTAQVQENMSEAANNPSAYVQRYLAKTLEKNWHVIGETTHVSVDVIGEISHASFEKVTLFLHHIVRALASEIVKYPCLECIESKMQFEEAFARVIDHEAQAIPQCLKQYKQDCLRSEGVDLTCLEAKLEEIDAISCSQSVKTESENQDLEMKENTSGIRRLLRTTRVASLDHFCSEFASYVWQNKNKFLFLQLCLLRLDVVQYVRHLPALLKWNSLLSSRLNHAIKRDDAMQMKVADFLSNDRYHSGTESMTKACDTFYLFQKAWNQVRDGWNLLTGTSPTFGIITSASSIINCVVDKNEKNCPLRQMISTLQGVQNNFLMDTLAIAKQGNCPTVNFLLKGDNKASIQTVPLQSAGNAVIQYEWSDNVLVFHDVDTNYGYGSVINYNYTTIERNLAYLLVLNKAILTEGIVSTQFDFSDYLFHACSAILFDLGTTLVQQKLSAELVNSIKREQEHHQTFANRLMDHLEIIIVLLKKTGGDPGSSLDEYIKRWSTLLPGSFSDSLLPQPRDGIKLHHIVSLYETLEDLLVGGVLESMHARYRADLPEMGERYLTQNLKPLSIEKLEETAALIRRFIFRFLRSDTKINSNTDLTNLVKKSVGGTMDCSLFTDILADDMEVKHIVKILEFIDKQVQQRHDSQSKRELQQHRPSHGARPDSSRGTSRSTRKRRGVMGSGF